MKVYNLGRLELAVLFYLISHPGGGSSAVIAAAVGRNSANIRSALRQLKAEGMASSVACCWKAEPALFEELAAGISAAAARCENVVPATTKRENVVPATTKPETADSDDFVVPATTKNDVARPPRVENVVASTTFREGGEGGLGGGEGESALLFSEEIGERKGTVREVQQSFKQDGAAIEKLFDNFWSIEGLFRKRPHRSQALEIFTRICHGNEAKTRAISREYAGPVEVARAIAEGSAPWAAEYRLRDAESRPYASTWLRQGLWASELEVPFPSGARESEVLALMIERLAKRPENWRLCDATGDATRESAAEARKYASLADQLSESWPYWVKRMTPAVLATIAEDREKADAFHARSLARLDGQDLERVKRRGPLYLLPESGSTLAGESK